MKVGDKVKWTSQAQGYTRMKEGEVVAVIAEGDRPSREAFLDLYKGPGCGYGRTGESYVVRVGRKHYWPRASLLEAQGPGELEHTKAKLQAALCSLRSFDPKLADHIEAM